MAATRIQDLIVPEVFADYVLQRTAEKSAIISSGIASTDATIQARASQGGAMIHLPYFNDLSGDAEVLQDTGELELNAVTAEEDVAVKIIRGKAWGGNDLVTVMVGVDPISAVANRVADFWVRQEQKTLIATLNGVFATALAATHVHDVSATTGLTSTAILDGKQLLGDAGDSIAAIVMHSAKYTELQKANLIAYLPVTQVDVRIPTYLGYRVIVDDGCPFANSKYTSYLFAQGAVAYADVAVPNAIEFDRYSLKSQDVMITRKGWISHVRGVKWAVSDSNPDNAKLATGANWTQVYDNKQIRVVKLITQ